MSSQGYSPRLGHYLEFELVARKALREAKIVGLTPGASAPEIFVEDVVEASSALSPVELTTLPAVAENVNFKLPAGLND
ncbi:MAG: hypothetical protein WA624_17020 [Methylocella sp.]